MAKIMTVIMGTVFALGFWVTNAFAGEQMAMSMGKPSALSSLVGTLVLNFQGEYLGRVSDFVIDAQGHVTFVVISHGGFLRIGEKDAAVPYGPFSYDRQKRHFVLDMTREKLQRGPEFAKQVLYSEMWAEHVYRYFGQAPYWTEGELVEKGVKPTEAPLEDFGESFMPYGYIP
jgi:sporulation protein YlmC with PRC-barrel domain